MASTIKKVRAVSPFDSGDIETNDSRWQSGVTWGAVKSSGTPDSTATDAGETGTCYQIKLVTDVAHDGDEFKVSVYTQSVCPSPLWVYVLDKQIVIQTKTMPTGTLRLIGSVLHQ